MQLEEAQKRVRELDAELLIARNATAEAERKGQVNAMSHSQPPPPPLNKTLPVFLSRRCLIAALYLSNDHDSLLMQNAERYARGNVNLVCVLQAAFQARGSETTVAELKVMLGSMQGQRAALQREVEREKAAAVCRAELSSQAAAAQSSLQVRLGYCA